MNTPLRLLAAAVLSAVVSACGQKGALYLPDAKPQTVGAPQAGTPAEEAAARRKAQQSTDSATNR